MFKNPHICPQRTTVLLTNIPERWTADANSKQISQHKELFEYANYMHCTHNNASYSSLEVQPTMHCFSAVKNNLWGLNEEVDSVQQQNLMDLSL